MAVSTKAGTFTVLATDTVGTTQQITVGFAPKLMLFWSLGQASATTAINKQTTQYGFGAAASSSLQYAIGSISTDTAAAINGGRVARNNSCFVTALNTGTADGQLNISATDSTSFTVNVSNQFATSIRVSYLAIGGDDITNVAMGTLAAATATGTQNVTGLGFQPDLLMTLDISSTTAPNYATTNRGYMAIGAASGPSNQAILAVGEGPEANVTSQSTCYAYSGEVIAPLFDTPTSIANRAALSQFLSDGFQLNWLEAAYAYQVIYIAVKGGSWAVGTTQTQTDTTTDSVVSGLSFAPKAAMLLVPG